MSSQSSIQKIEKVNALSAQDLIDLGERFLAAHDVTAISRAGYRRRLRALFHFIETNNILRPTRKDILAYKRHLVGSKFTAYTVSGYLTAVRRFFAWLEAEGLYFDAAKTIKGPRKQKGFRKDALTAKQTLELLKSVDRTNLIGKRDFAMVNLMLRRGLRSIELVRASVGDIRQQGNQAVLWVQGKGRSEKDEFIVLGAHVADPIMEYLTLRGTTKPDDALFGTLSTNCMNKRISTRAIRRIIKEQLRCINLDSPRLSAHSCRHTAVTLSLMGGATLQETQQMARHSDINSTLIYSHNINRSAGIPEQAIDDLLDREQDCA
jgi:integrase/recombinase XerD